MKNITGTLINYYFHCKTQMWLHSNKINLEDNSEDVRIGRVLHQINENRVNEVAFENIKVDKITKDYLIEVKKSDSDLDSAKWQLLFYLFRLKQKGIIRKGRLEIFEKRKQNKKKFEIILDKQSERELLDTLNRIEEILSQESPPEPELKPKCKKCAYYEYCFL